MQAARQALAQGDAPGAVALLEKAAAARPGNAQIEELLGTAYLQAQRAQAALLHFERARQAGAGGAELFLDLGLASWELNRVAEAERAFRDALATGGGAAAAHQLGRLLVWQGRYAEALEYLQQAARIHPGDVDLALDLGSALGGAGREADALALYRELVGRAPELPRLRYRLARALRQAGQAAAAEAELEVYRSLLARERERLRTEGVARARLDEGWDLYRSGRASQALVLFEALPESVESLCGIAFSQSALGAHAAAATALERAVTLAPDRNDLRMALAEERLAAEKR